MLNASAFLVRDLPDLPEEMSSSLVMHSGHIPLDEAGHDLIFFWLVRSNISTSNLVFWFNGGPGCSSMDGIFVENGPWKFGLDSKFHHNPNSWHNLAHVIYVDQPFGVGYSFSETTRVFDSSQAALHMEKFLFKFIEIFPEYASSKLYLTGESFAGQYIPYFADHILRINLLDSNKEFPKLSGILLGAPWLFPKHQYLDQIEFAKAHGLLTEIFLERAEKQLDLCMNMIDRYPLLPRLFECENIANIIIDESKSGGKQCINFYDIRLRDDAPGQGCGMSWPPGIVQMANYLSRTDVKSALHAEKWTTKHWNECNGSLNNGFFRGNASNSIHILPSLLQHMPIFVYGSEFDLSCTYNGIFNGIQDLEWCGGKGFSDDPRSMRQEWYVNRNSAGTWLSARNMTLAFLYGASHMAPFDAPLSTVGFLQSLLSINDPSLKPFVNLTMHSKLVDGPIADIEPSFRFLLLFYVLTSASILVTCSLLCYFVLRRSKYRRMFRLPSYFSNGSSSNQYFELESLQGTNVRNSNHRDNDEPSSKLLANNETVISLDS